MEAGMTAPKIVQAVAAVYPEDAYPEGNGHCTLSMTIDQNGVPLFIHLVHSAGEAFDSAAIYAVRQSKFDPGLREGKAVPIRTIVRVTFTADHAPAVPEIVKRTYVGTGDSVRADYPPKVTRRGEVEYSEEARKKRINGAVLISLLVTEEGLPAEVHVVRGMGYGLDEKAMEAVRQYRFQPAMKDGKPIAQHISIEVNFQLY
jgi:TonB family protein